MNESEKKRISKLMSLGLRHKPEAIFITLDNNGWTSTAELISGINKKGLGLSQESLEIVVSENDKQRFIFSDDKKRIRANQGHSLNVDLGLKEQTPPEFLYHGTVSKFVAAIQVEGLKKMNRQHVHLSEEIKTANTVGSRRGKAVILTVRAGEMNGKGIPFFQSENGVWLTDKVSPQYIDLEK